MIISTQNENISVTNHKNDNFVKPGFHMLPMIGESLSVIIQGEYSQRILLMSNHRQWLSPMIGESLSVIIQGENSQRILLMSNHRQWLSPMSATHENQA